MVPRTRETEQRRPAVKRPAAWFCLAFSGAVFFAVYLLAGWQELLLGAVLLYIGLVCCLRKRQRVALLCLGGALGLWLSWQQTSSLVLLECSYVGQTETLSLQVQDYPRKTAYGVSVTGEVRTQGALEGRTVTLWLPEGQGLLPGDQLRAQVKLKTARDDQSQWQWYAWSQGIALEGTADCAEISRPGTPWTLLPKVWAHRLDQGLRRYFSDETAGFLFALTTGHQENLSDELKDALSETGLRHVTAASGLHVHLLVSALCLLPGLWRRGVLLLPLLLAFAALAGFTPSICRAAVMEGILLLGPLFRREPDGLTSLSVALALLLGQNVYASASVSLQLSFAALFGLLIVCPALLRRVRSKKTMPWLAGLKKSLIVTLGANVFTLPLTLCYFGTVSLLTPLSNLVVLWVLPVLLPCALLCGLGGWLCLPVGQILAGPVGLLAELCLRLIYALADFPWSTLPENAPCWAWIGLGYGVGLLLWWGRSSRRQSRAAVLLWLALLPGAMWTATAAERWSELTVSLLDVGQGQCLVLMSEEETAVVDCGGSGTWAEERLKDTLIQQGREKIDHLILTHYDEDHTGGVAQLLREGRVGCLWLPQFLPEDESRAVQLAELARLSGVPVNWVTQETALELEETRLQLLPLETGDYRGTAVLVSLGEFDLLDTGDADMQGEEQLLSQLPQVEVLIAGHHGSAGSTGEALLAAADPQLVLFSVGENGYGHPAQETLDRCKEAGAELRRTDQNGTITLWVSGLGGR